MLKQTKIRNTIVFTMPMHENVFRVFDVFMPISYEPLKFIAGKFVSNLNIVSFHSSNFCYAFVCYSMAYQSI